MLEIRKLFKIGTLVERCAKRCRASFLTLPMKWPIYFIFFVEKYELGVSARVVLHSNTQTAAQRCQGRLCLLVFTPSSTRTVSYGGMIYVWKRIK